jgi:CRP-like cAMP-binding protein
MADTDIDFDLLVRAGGPVISFKAGDVIFREGDPALELIVIESGTVEIRIRNGLVDTLGERSIFGEMALIDSRPPRAQQRSRYQIPNSFRSATRGSVCWSPTTRSSR